MFVPNFVPLDQVGFIHRINANFDLVVLKERWDIIKVSEKKKKKKKIALLSMSSRQVEFSPPTYTYMQLPTNAFHPRGLSSEEGFGFNASLKGTWTDMVGNVDVIPATLQSPAHSWNTTPCWFNQRPLGYLPASVPLTIRPWYQ